MKNWKTWVPIFVTTVVTIFGWFVFKPSTQGQNVQDSPQSIITQNQMGNNILIIPQRSDRVLTQEVIAQITQRLPIDADKEILIITESNKMETLNLAEQIKSRLEKLGRVYVHIGTQIPFGPIDGDIGFSTGPGIKEGTRFEILVADK